MSARRVYIHLKANSAGEFTERVEKEIIPVLRKQTGFQDEITLVSSGGKKAFSISLWDKPENAEAYNKAACAGVANIMATVIEGSPHVGTFDVANSTFHKISSVLLV